MSNNTVLKEDQQKAVDWWANIGRDEKADLMSRYNHYAKIPLELDQLEYIWRSETQQSIPSETLTDRLLDNPAQEEEDYNDFIDAAIPSNTGEVKGEDWTPGEWVKNGYT